MGSHNEAQPQRKPLYGEMHGPREEKSASVETLDQNGDTGACALGVKRRGYAETWGGGARPARIADGGAVMSKGLRESTACRTERNGDLSSWISLRTTARLK